MLHCSIFNSTRSSCFHAGASQVPPLEKRPPAQQDVEEAAFGQAAWREADEQGRRAAMSSVGPGTYTSHPGGMDTPQQRLAKQLAADAAMKELLGQTCCRSCHA